MGVNGIYGLSGSGLDIESLVKMGMMNKQNQYDKMYQNQVKQTWMKEAYVGVYNDMKTFQDTMSTFKLQSNMSAMKASSTSDSIVTATANGAAANMAHKVTVSQVASNAYIMTGDGKTITRNTTDTAAASSSKLSDVMFKSAVANSDGTYKITLADGTEKTVNGTDKAVSLTLQDSKTATDDHGNPVTYELSYTFDDLIKDGKTLSDMATAVANTGANIQGNYDTATDSFSFYNKTTGDDNIIGLDANNEYTATLLNNLHLASYDTNNNSLTDLSDFSVSNAKMKSTSASLSSDKLADLAKIDLTGSYTGTDTALEFTLDDGSGHSTTVSLTYDDILDSSNQSATGDMSTLVDKINEAAKNGGLDVTASYDADKKQFSLTSTSGKASLTGTNDDSKTFTSALNMGDAYRDGGATLVASGTNAKATIDGKSYDLTTNTKTIAGVTYTFNDTTKAGETATVNVSQDTDTIVDNVKKFVDAYNTLLDSLTSKYSESKNSDYSPLTKTQESAMTEDQINKWNDKAKAGLLYHDSNVRSLISDMREAIYTKMDTVDTVYTDANGNKIQYNSMSAIGISISGNDYTGHITLDESKLKTALANDPDCVYQLFAPDQDSTYVSGTTSKNNNNNTSYNKKNDYANTGVASRLYNAMTENMSTFSDMAGTTTSTDDQSYYGKLITNLQTKMSSFKTQMDSYQTLLYNKYDAMEVALSKLGTQLSYITG